MFVGCDCKYWSESNSHVIDEYWSAVGSLNGGEISHKVNREVVLMVDHPLVHDRLFEVFLHDWAMVTNL